jgi:hypothetical protein
MFFNAIASISHLNAQKMSSVSTEILLASEAGSSPFGELNQTFAGWGKHARHGFQWLHLPAWQKVNIDPLFTQSGRPAVPF